MKWLRRCLPRRMSNQLAWLLALALAASNLIAIAGIQLTGALLHPVSRTLALERLTIAYQAAESLPASDAEQLLTSMNAGDTHFWIAAQPDVSPFDMQPEERRLAADLAARPPLAPDASIVMQLESRDGGLARGHFFSPTRWEPLRLRTTIRLPDGRYLNGLQHPIQAYEWSRLLSYSLPVTSVPLVLMMVFFMRRVVQPVKRLAAATDRVSRGEWIAPLPLSGPQEARELTQAFNVMQERIARHVEGRTRMLAAISHDLNTPITELRLQVELLAEGPERDDMLESLAELNAMVSETLNFVRGDAMQEPTGRLSITDTLDDLVRRYRMLGHQVSWPGGAPMAIRGRPLALKRALGNLIDNAIVHGGDAALSLWREADDIRIEIRDRGPGIDPACLDQVFEPFVQLGQHRGRGEGEIGAGAGLGLSIARACIHAHGGELILENRSPTGLCAVVWLPAD